MPPPIPIGDGDLNLYNLGRSTATVPRIYYVNGIQTSPQDHAITASYLSLLVERPIVGVFNLSAGKGTVTGFLADIAQCLADVLQNATARPFSSMNAGKPQKIPEDKINDFLLNVEKQYFVWNRATLELFKELVRHRHERQLIIAHSQGNLITSNALFVVEDVLGSGGLKNIRVYSLASPSPGWPLGLRITNGGGGRQDNAFMNDMVSLLRPQNFAKKIGIGAFQNAGDFRTMPNAWPVGFAPHDVNKIIESLNFVKSIRGDLGLSKEFPPEFLQQCSRTAQAAFPNLAK